MAVGLIEGVDLLRDGDAVGGQGRHDLVVQGVDGQLVGGGVGGRGSGGGRLRGRGGAVGRRGVQAELGGAGGPGAPALGGQHALGDDDLLLAGGLVGSRGVLGATVGGPGARVELQTPVVAVAGVDRPVTTGLALGQTVPVGVRGGGGARREDRAGGAHGDGAGGELGEQGGGVLGVASHEFDVSSRRPSSRPAPGCPVARGRSLSVDEIVLGESGPSSWCTLTATLLWASGRARVGFPVRTGFRWNGGTASCGA